MSKISFKNLATGKDLTDFSSFDRACSPPLSISPKNYQFKLTWNSPHLTEFGFSEGDYVLFTIDDRKMYLVVKENSGWEIVLAYTNNIEYLSAVVQEARNAQSAAVS